MWPFGSSNDKETKKRNCDHDYEEKRWYSKKVMWPYELTALSPDEEHLEVHRPLQYECTKCGETMVNHEYYGKIKLHDFREVEE